MPMTARMAAEHRFFEMGCWHHHCCWGWFHCRRRTGGQQYTKSQRDKTQYEWLNTVATIHCSFWCWNGAWNWHNQRWWYRGDWFHNRQWIWICIHFWWFTRLHQFLNDSETFFGNRICSHIHKVPKFVKLQMKGLSFYLPYGWKPMVKTYKMLL